MKISDVIVHFLIEKNIKHVFGYQGGSITHIIDSISKSKVISYIQNYNEQASALSADAYARIASEGIGVAIATNGPGATNLITGIANAYCDSIPVLFITGQVHSFAMKKGNVRQESFQEIDILSMVSSVTKYSVTVLKKEDIIFELEKAYQMAVNGRKGPVLVDIPVDIQGEDIEVSELKRYMLPNEKHIYNDSYFHEVYELMKNSKRPIILAGGGIQLSNASNAFESFINNVKIPVVTSLQGLDSVMHSHYLFRGFIGSFGNRYANFSLHYADLIIVLGSRLDMRQIGKDSSKFAPFAKVVHVDIDETELGHVVKNALKIKSDLLEFITSFNNFITENDLAMSLQYDNWIDLTLRWKNILENRDLLKVNKFIYKLGQTLKDEWIICSDVGQNQMWIAQSLRLNSSVRILNSGGLGTMGFSLAAGIGSYFAIKSNRIISFMGDGGFQMNLQELETIRREKIPLKIVIFNNKSLGLIRDIHEKYYEDRFEGSVMGYSVPNLRKVAEAYDINYLGIDDLEVNELLIDAMNSEQSYLIEIKIYEPTYVQPELLGKNSLNNQFPYLDENEVQNLTKEIEL